MVMMAGVLPTPGFPTMMMAALKSRGYTSGRMNVFREGDVKAGSRQRELSHGNGPGNTTRLILAHAPDFDFWPTCQGGTGVGLDVGQDPVGLLIESVAVWSEGVDVANALRKLVILRRP